MVVDAGRPDSVVVNHHAGQAQNVVQAKTINELNIHTSNDATGHADDEPRSLADHRAAVDCRELLVKARSCYRDWPDSNLLPVCFPSTWRRHLDADDPIWPLLEVLDALEQQVSQIGHRALSDRIRRISDFLTMGAGFKRLVGGHIFDFAPVVCDYGVNVCDAFLRDAPMPPESSIVASFMDWADEALRSVCRGA